MIVRLTFERGRKEEKKLENEGKQVPFFRFLEIGTISFELGEIGERYASLTNKQTNKQNKK
jgi:hypothetical protein